MAIAAMLTAALWLAEPQAAAPAPDRFTLSDGSVILGTLKDFGCDAGRATSISITTVFAAALVVPADNIISALVTSRGGPAGSSPPNGPMDLMKTASEVCARRKDETTWLFAAKVGASPSIATQSQSSATADGTFAFHRHPAVAGIRQQQMTVKLTGNYTATTKDGSTSKQVEMFYELAEYFFNVDRTLANGGPRTWVYVVGSNYHNYSLGVSSERNAGIGVTRDVTDRGHLALSADLRLMDKHFFDYAPTFTSLASRLRQSTFFAFGPVTVNEVLEFYPTFASMNGREARANAGFSWAITPGIAFDVSATIDYVHDAPPNHKQVYLKPTASLSFKFGT